MISDPNRRAANDDDVTATVDLLHAVARGTAHPLPAVRRRPQRSDRAAVDAIVAVATR